MNRGLFRAFFAAGALSALGTAFRLCCPAPEPGTLQEVPQIVFRRYGDREILDPRWRRLRTEADADWRRRQAALRPLEGLGETSRLEILPIVEAAAAAPGLLTEPGVAYLLRTDNSTVLFDLGFNQESAPDSPLTANMSKLGVRREKIGIIFISHPHRDHVGGHYWEERGTFGFGRGQPPLGRTRIYAPIPLTYPGSVPQLSEDPAVLAPGLASVGVIRTPDYFTGMISEQALAVNVRGKGIVLVVGCGHQGLERLLARAKKLFREPLYAVVGGLHYPVSGSRLAINGVGVQKYFGTGRPPWEPVTLEDVRRGIRALKAENIRLIAVSPHDSCDLALAEFRKAFPGAWRPLAAGDPLRF